MYACTFPVVVVHGLMALEDQISVKSFPLIVKCLKFCRVGCHNETTLISIFYKINFLSLRNLPRNKIRNLICLCIRTDDVNQQL